MTESLRNEMVARGITLTFTSGARVDLLEEEAAWLRDELLRGEFALPKRDAGAIVERALTAPNGNAELPPAAMTPANVVELAWGAPWDAGARFGSFCRFPSPHASS